jgi:hypothetical protein
MMSIDGSDGGSQVITPCDHVFHGNCLQVSTSTAYKDFAAKFDFHIKGQI